MAAFTASIGSGRTPYYFLYGGLLEQSGLHHELFCGRMQPAVLETYFERVATMNYGMSSSAFHDNRRKTKLNH